MSDPPSDPPPEFPEEWSLKEINTRRYPGVAQTGKTEAGRVTKGAIRGESLRQQLHDVARIQWGDTREKADSPDDPDEWERVRKQLHYDVDNAEIEYNESVEKIKYEMERRQEVVERLGEETAEVDELQSFKISLDLEIAASEEKRKSLSNALSQKSRELASDEIVVEELRKELAKVRDTKDGLRGRLADLKMHSSQERAHWKSQRADADQQIRDHRHAIANFEANLATLQDKLAREVARAKEMHVFYATKVAKLEQDVAASQAALDKASAAKTTAVNAFAEEREKWQQSHRENRAMERKMAEERKSLLAQSQDLDLQLDENFIREYRKSRPNGLGSRSP